MLSRSTVTIPNVSHEGGRYLLDRSTKIEIEAIKSDISGIIEAIACGQLSEQQQARLRSYLFAHYHPELKIRPRVHIYQAVKSVLEDDNLNQLRNIVGIRQKSAYLNTISNVGKRSSYFGGLIGISVVGFFFLPPIVKLGIIPVAKRTVKKLIPRQNYLIPIDKSLKLSSLIGKSPSQIYKGIQSALGSRTRRAGSPVPARIDTAAMDDLTGNLFFRALIEESDFTNEAKADFRGRAQIAFLYDMAGVSRQLEGLARDPALSWERISNYTNFAMFLKSMESREVPILDMLQFAIEVISRAQIGKKKKDVRFYTEFERGLKNLNYALSVVEPLDKFNETDAFDDLESRDAKLAFFEQNRLVMERLYIEHEPELAEVRPMFSAFKETALKAPPQSAQSDREKYEAFQRQITKILATYRSSLRALGRAELRSYDRELIFLRS